MSFLKKRWVTRVETKVKRGTSHRAQAIEAMDSLCDFTSLGGFPAFHSRFDAEEAIKLIYAEINPSFRFYIFTGCAGEKNYWYVD